GVDAGRDVEAKRRAQGEPAEEAGRVPREDERRGRTGVAGSGARPAPAGGGRDRGAAGPGDSPSGAGGREPAGLTAATVRLAAGHQYPPSAAKSRFQANLRAIGTARALDAEDRPATREEQEALAAWSSWGAIPDVFDDRKDEWATEREQLKAVLSAEDYE